MLLCSKYYSSDFSGYKMSVVWIEKKTPKIKALEPKFGL
jgi:hypothetical protein